MVVAMDTQDEANKIAAISKLELAFSKVLASNEKKLRDNALKKLRTWLSVKCQNKYEFTEEDFKAIWIGLQYSMWMSDKPLVQEDLAESISELVHCFKENEPTFLLFVETFLNSIIQMWNGIDQHRIDKFLMFVRRFLRQTLLYCRNRNWSIKTIRRLMKIYKQKVIMSSECIGIALHLIDIFLEELAKVSDDKLKPDALLTFIHPFAVVIATTNDARIRTQCRDFFRHLMKQTDVAIEAEELFDKWKKSGFAGGKIDTFLEEIQSDEEDDDTAEEAENTTLNDEEKAENVEKEPAPEGEIEEDKIEDGRIEQEKIEDKKNGTEKVWLDPRAGGVNVELPQLGLSLLGIIKLLRRQHKSPIATVKGRRLVSHLSLGFKKLKRGEYPMPIKEIPKANFGRKKMIKKGALSLIRSSSSKQSRAKLLSRIKKLNEKLKEEKEKLARETSDDEEESSPKKRKIHSDSDSIEKNDVTSVESGIEKKSRKNVDDAGHSPTIKVKHSSPKKTKHKSELDVPSPIVNGGSNEESNVIDEECGIDIDKKKFKDGGVVSHSALSIDSPSVVKSKKRKTSDSDASGSEDIGKIQSPEGNIITPKKRKNKLERNLSDSVLNENKTEDKDDVLLNSNEKVQKKNKNKSKTQSTASFSAAADSTAINAIKLNVKQNGKWTAEDVDENVECGNSNSPKSPPENKARKRKLSDSWMVEECSKNATLSLPNIVTVEKKDPWSDELEEGEVEIFVPYKKKSVPAPKSPVFWDRAKAKVSPKKSPKSETAAVALNLGTPKSGRRISFNLQKNRAQAHHEYFEGIERSPQVPYDSSKKPPHSALKAGLPPSPINPFYLRRKNIKLPSLTFE